MRVGWDRLERENRSVISKICGDLWGDQLDRDPLDIGGSRDPWSYLHWDRWQRSTPLGSEFVARSAPIPLVFEGQVDAVGPKCPVAGEFSRVVPLGITGFMSILE